MLGFAPEYISGCDTSDLAIPLVGLTGMRVNERDFALKPEQGPFALVLASGNLLLHAARATDFQDKQAGNTMALEELLSDAI